jgi:hypothetical protein
MDPLMPLNQSLPDDPVAQMQQVLQQMRALQTQPLVPNSQAAQAGTILQGFHAGIQGRPNPAIQMHLDNRALQLKNLSSQAGISTDLASIENSKLTRDQALKKYNLDLYKTLSNDEDFNTRVAGFKAGIQAGILPPDLDPNLAAMKAGKEYERGHDQVLALVQKGIDPTSDPRYASMFPREVFGSAVQKAQQALASGPEMGALAINQMKLKPDQPENIMKIEIARLEMIPPSKRTDEDKRQLAGYQRALNYDSLKGGTTVERLAEQLKVEDMQAGKPPRLPSAYIDQANDMLKDRDSTIQQIKKMVHAEHPNWKEGTPDYERAIYEELAALSGARAASTQSATRLPERERNMMQILDTARDFAITKLLTDFTPQERLKYAGWFNFKGRQLAQAIQADPKFAQFRSYVMQGKSMAFSDGGKNLTAFEGGITFGWVPTGDEISPVDFEEKLKIAADRLDYVRKRIIMYSVTPTSEFTRDLKKTMTGPPPTPTSPSGVKFRYETGPDGKKRVVFE